MPEFLNGIGARACVGTTSVLIQPVDQTLRIEAYADTVGSSSMVRALKHEVDKPQLSYPEQALELWAVDTIALKGIQEYFPVHFVSEVVLQTGDAHEEIQTPGGGAIKIIRNCMGLSSQSVELRG